MPLGPFFSVIASYLSYANTFIPPAAIKANARRTCTTHKATFMCGMLFSPRLARKSMSYFIPSQQFSSFINARQAPSVSR
jgi:hypothetical protein